MSAKHPFRLRRDYVELPDARHDELMEASKTTWRPCFVALTLGALFLPLVGAFAIAFGVHALFPALPTFARASLAGGGMLLMYLGPKVLLRRIGSTKLNCIQAASFRLFVKARQLSG